MKSKMAEHQKQMWRFMLLVMEKQDVMNLNFCGFMADSAQANFIAVQEIFGTGDKTQPMVNRERTCLFHWTTTLDCLTK